MRKRHRLLRKHLSTIFPRQLSEKKSLKILAQLLLLTLRRRQMSSEQKCKGNYYVKPHLKLKIETSLLKFKDTVPSFFFGGQTKARWQCP